LGVIEVQSADSTPVATTTTTASTHHTEPEFSSPTESTIVANSTPEGIQEATVAAEQSYQPERVIVEAGNLYDCTPTHNPSKCFDLMFCSLKLLGSVTP